MRSMVVKPAYVMRMNAERTPNVCDICQSDDDVKLIEERFAWGNAVRVCRNKGYTGRPIPWCAGCRKKRGRHSFRYAPAGS